jgi:hypothetical protein
MNAMISGLAKALRKMPTKRYTDYLRSVNWQKIRQEHLERVNFLCEICRRARAMQVHHWTYVRLGYERPTDLCAVCVRCHHVLHCMVEPIAANDNQLTLPMDLGQKKTG